MHLSVSLIRARTDQVPIRYNSFMARLFQCRQRTLARGKAPAPAGPRWEYAPREASIAHSRHRPLEPDRRQDWPEKESPAGAGRFLQLFASINLSSDTSHDQEDYKVHNNNYTSDDVLHPPPPRVDCPPRTLPSRRRYSGKIAK